ncbi:hypothetical protein ADL06_13710, partial [Streptomyces sp. NRRL F-6491]
GEGGLAGAGLADDAEGLPRREGEGDVVEGGEGAAAPAPVRLAEPFGGQDDGAGRGPFDPGGRWGRIGRPGEGWAWGRPGARVDLPEPDSPTMPRVSPAARVRETSSRAVKV